MDNVGEVKEGNVSVKSNLLRGIYRILV
jgi:hypothetical protein